MSSENGWIPWDEREDIQKYVVLHTYDIDFHTNPPTEYYRYYYIGRVHNKFVDDFQDEIDEHNFNYDICLVPFDRFNEQEKREILRYYFLHKNDKEIAFLWDIKRALENVDRELFRKPNNSAIASPSIPASAPADETSGGRTVIDEKLKYDIGVFMKENPNCSNRDITKKFGMGTGTISSNPDLKAFVERCRRLNIRSMENNPNFDNDPFSNGRGRRNE